MPHNQLPQPTINIHVPLGFIAVPFPLVRVFGFADAAVSTSLVAAASTVAVEITGEPGRGGTLPPPSATSGAATSEDHT